MTHQIGDGFRYKSHLSRKRWITRKKAGRGVRIVDRLYVSGEYDIYQEIPHFICEVEVFIRLYNTHRPAGTVKANLWIVSRIPAQPMKSLRLLAALAATCTSVFAITITITPNSGVLNTTRWEGQQTSQAQIDTAIAAIMGAGYNLVYANNNPAETGGLAGSYETTFVPANDPQDALVQYVGGSVASPTVYGLVKDGNADPAWYLFNLTALGWNGVDDLLFDNFWPSNGAISHVSLYAPGVSVPDGGAGIALLGFALLCVDVIRRRLMG